MAALKTTIAVIGGTGALGTGLARRLAKAGHDVVIGSRTREKAETAAAEITAALAGQSSGRVTAAANAEAAAAGEIIVLTVPWSSHAVILDEIAPHVAGRIVVDTTVPLVPPRVARVQLPASGSAAMATGERLGGTARVVAAFHSVAAHKLQQDIDIDCDVLVFGDEAADRAVVIELAQAAGLRGLHGGPLVNAVAAEALTSILIGINRTYRVDGAGIRITGIAATSA